MISRVKYFLPLLLFLFSSCFLKKKNGDVHQDSHQKISDINSHQSPKQIAKEYAEFGKKQKRAYKKQLRKTEKAIKKRNEKKTKGKGYKNKN